MTFVGRIRNRETMITEGSVVERLRRNPAVALDPILMHAAFVETDRGRADLKRLFDQYIGIGREFGLPVLLCTPTWRANPERIRDAGRQGARLNEAAAGFMSEVRAGHPGFSDSIHIGGLMGCRGDCYRPQEGLSEENARFFHREQAESLASSGVDFLMASTLPAVSEALGMARALAETGKPYVVSFVVRPDGRVLDGTPLCDAIARIDDAVLPQPATYWINCVHPSNLKKALEAEAARGATADGRLTGIQGNTSALSPEELEGRPELDSQEPEAFAEEILELHDQWGVKVLGGCCGSDDRHIRAIARGVAERRQV